MVTAVCNIFINSDSKFELFKKTFPCVYDISDNWLINIRGKYREDTIEHIKETFSNFENNCTFFSSLYDDNWAKSTKKMLANSKYDYIYVFLEDHFLLKPLEHFKNVVQNMKDSKIEYFGYSFFNIGLSTQSAEGLCPDYSKYFFSFQFDQKKIGYLRKNNPHFYPYSLASICTKKYFQKLLLIENKFLIKIPLLIQAAMENVLFFYPKNRAFWFNVNKFISKIGFKFVIYPTATPFNLEKSLFDCDSKLLPLVVGGLREELFANWDDDNILSNSSLVKRGLYPPVLKSTANTRNYESTAEKEYIIQKGTTEIKQFYPEISRISHVPVKWLLVKSGVAKICSKKESYILKEGEQIYLHTNVPHKIEAMEDLVYSVKIYLKQ